MGTEYKLFANEVNFKKYLASLSWVADLDSRYKVLPTQSKIADYYIEGIAVIELKTIKKDAREKIEKYVGIELNKNAEKGEFPILYGEKLISIDLYAAVCSEQSSFEKKVAQYYFRTIERLLRNANKQIESSLQQNDISSESCGVVIIIFEGDDYYDPNSIAGLVSAMMMSGGRGIESKIPYINSVVLLQESFKIAESNLGQTIIPSITIHNSAAPVKKTTEVMKSALSYLINSYSQYCGIFPIFIDNDDQRIDLGLTLIKK